MKLYLGRKKYEKNFLCCSFLILSMGIYTETIKVISAIYPGLEGKTNLGNDGLNVEILKALCKEAGIDLEVKQYPRNRAIQLLKSGNSQMYLGSINHLDKNMRKDYIEVPISIVESVLFYMKEKYPNFSWKDYKDLKKYFIGTQTGGNIPRVAKENKLNFEETPDTRALIKKLYTGRNNMIVLVDFAGLALIKEMYPGESSKFAYSTKPFYITEIGLLVNKNYKEYLYLEERLYKALDKLYKNGTWESLMKKYSINDKIPVEGKNYVEGYLKSKNSNKKK